MSAGADGSAAAELALVYACSGCSSVAQLANTCAVRLDREGKAEMSCISGVGGGVLPLVRLARSGRPILALDGCALACVSACLQNAGVIADAHLVLNREGAKNVFTRMPVRLRKSRCGNWYWQKLLVCDRLCGLLSLRLNLGLNPMLSNCPL